MPLDFTTDYQVWDTPEAITHVSVQNSGDVPKAIATALRLPLDTREQTASDGAYAAQDVIWLLPKPLISPTEPKSGDLVRDAGGTDWTALEVSFGPLDGTYRLKSRDLVLHFDLRDEIDIERAVITQDAGGAKIKTWSKLEIDLPAKVQPITATITDERGMRGLRITHSVIVGKQLLVINEDRILFGGKYYEIRGYHNPQRIDELPVIDAELMP